MCSLKKVLGISLFISFSRPPKFLIFMTLNVNATYNGIKRNFLLRLRVFYFKVKIFHCALLANLSPNCQENDQNQHAMHTVSFYWFLSSLEWIINLEFCLLKLLIFYQKLLWNIRSRLCKKFQFWSTISKYRAKNSKCGRVKPRSDIP